MPDNLNIKEPLDKTRINIHESWELNWWSKHFGVSNQKIINAVSVVGTSASKVKEYLGK
ncbi:DUF3606 domain-containing protein [Clostridium tyrobutyricum]|uniref:DUF3606 domain-containing protein n=1 Tax=Clostridium tyrobutyricum TaxID=1519 RepID=UPI001C389E39|nr:DUF3606 domain-containing protein [Clostridium tyrobutyricum]MBV4447971.1 DUF3606 domain-containing protein [Clostridium tyrobutyricum]